MDPKLRSKSYNPNMDLELIPEKNWPHFCSHMVIKTLDGSGCIKCIISTSATYIWHTHENIFKKMEFMPENGIDQYRE